MPSTSAPAIFHGARRRPEPHVGSRTETVAGPSLGTSGCRTSKRRSASQSGVKYCACLLLLNCRKLRAWLASRPAYAAPDGTSTVVTVCDLLSGCGVGGNRCGRGGSEDLR